MRAHSQESVMRNKGIRILISFSHIVSKTVISSVTQLCPTIYDRMDCSKPGFPAHHQLLELTQTHVHCISDAIQPSRPLLSPSPPTFNPSIRVSSPASGFLPVSQFFASGGQSIGVSASTSVLPVIIQDWFPLELTGLNLSIVTALIYISINDLGGFPFIHTLSSICDL